MENVLLSLEGNSTMVYIRQLEQEREILKNQLKESVLNSQNIKVYSCSINYIIVVTVMILLVDFKRFLAAPT